MAEVQVESGHVRIANSLYEALYRLRIPGRHKDVIACVVRYTFGFQKTRDTIAVAQIAAETLIDDRGVRRIMLDLVEWGVLGREARGPGRPSVWWVVKDFDRWQVNHTSHSKRVQSRKPRAQSPGSADPGFQLTPGAEPRAHRPGEDTHTPGAQTLETPGAQPPLQRQKDSKRESLSLGKPLEEVNRAFAHYPNPKTGIPRKVRKLQRRRMSAIVRDHLAGDRSKLGSFLAHAIHGYVCRNGLKVQDSGFDGWKFFEFVSIVSPSKIETNVAAALEALELGNRPPYRHGANTERRGKREAPGDAQKRQLEQEARARNRDELAARRESLEGLTPAEALERKLGEILKTSADTKFRRDRLAKVRFELAALRSGTSPASP